MYRKYYKIREKSFSEFNKEQSGQASDKILRIRQRHKELRNEHRIVESAILSSENDDIRPYAVIELFGEKVKGLLDSGATISVLGLLSVEFLKRHNIAMCDFRSKVKTAGGSTMPIIGKINATITFNGRSESINFYICPGLSQKLYLGFNFWKLIGLDTVLNLEVSEINAEIDSNKHKLTDLQNGQLERVINIFPSSQILGLGKTSIMEHIINTGDAKPVKRRYYPISPAKQKVIYDEIDRMVV